MRILAVSGSLRRASINSALLRTAAHVAPEGIEVRVFGGLGDLPLFNPDLEAQLPHAVAALYREVAAADALLIASPEYAHGVSGPMKNLLDWLVGFEPFVDKMIGVLNASPRAHHADDALRETLRTMSARIVEEASISIALLGQFRGTADMLGAPAVVAAIRAALQALAASTGT
jgi:NAD(P)H-dependent FMN reductase